MAKKSIRIGSMVDMHQYDNVAFDSAVETTEPMKAGSPVDPNDVVRLSDLQSITHPIGSVYLSVVATNPSVTLGFGTWIQIAIGQMLVGFKTADPDFGVLEGTGGNKTVSHDNNHSGASATFTGDALASHEHQLPISIHSADEIRLFDPTQAPFGGESANHTPWSRIDKTALDTTACPAAISEPKSAGTPSGSVSVVQSSSHSDHNILNPYFTIYVWKRTA